MTQCKHVRSGKRPVFATMSVGGEIDGKDVDVNATVCARCFGPMLWLMFDKLPNGASLVVSKREGEIKMKWAAVDEEQAP